MTPHIDDRRRCVLFDLDGTLINTWHLYMESFRLTLEPVFGRRLTDQEILDLHPQAERRLLLSLVEEAEFTPAFDRFLTHYSSLHDRLFGGPYDGVLDMLQQLHGQGYLLGIVTGKSREAWRITSARMEAQGFEQFFDVVLTDDDVQTPKPNPEGILAALDALEVEPAQAFFLGDSELDAQAAAEAGLPFGAALWAKDSDDCGLFASAARTTRTDGATDFPSPASVMTLFQTIQALPTLRKQGGISLSP
ncbi:MAG: HAD family hydrolase [Nitrospirae bacterium]|nr:MAG: HAD family hydrolase [Nitrospirota bacterium]